MSKVLFNFFNFDKVIWELIKGSNFRRSKLFRVFIVVLGKGHNYENQNVEKQPKRTSKISVFLVHHYYENQNVKKNEKNIKSLIFV